MSSPGDDSKSGTPPSPAPSPNPRRPHHGPREQSDLWYDAHDEHDSPPEVPFHSAGTAAPTSAPPIPSPALSDRDRLNLPQRSSTYGGIQDLERSRQHRDHLGGAAHARSEDLNHSASSSANTSSTNLTNGLPPSVAASSCAACGRPMQGAFVRALGSVYHLNCFKCMDCAVVVASKFFPIDGPDGKQYPLCERDYFRRLNLICAQCGMALRGSYITACNKKFHVEHFTCSLCSTLFGPQDSYYEHESDVYCHYHYSTRFATKCAGCNSAILKQFVEINRNNRDECWHPECYMINKFWNVKLVSRRSMTPSISDQETTQEQPEYVDEERRETPVTLKDRQARMEQQVYRIWTVLSAFEESSAACISDMLRQVSNGDYLDAIRMAEKFILHVEVLFATIDDLEWHFARLNMKGMSHVREARMLCRKTVDLFTLLSHTQETGARRMGMTQELLALVTGLAHYLKILIRIALTGALKLEREQDVREAITDFLDKLHLLAVQGGNPGVKRLVKGGGEQQQHGRGNQGTQGVTYGFKSLAPEMAGESPFAVAPREAKTTSPPSDLCIKCAQTVEEDCVRLGTYQRWHSHCVQCQTCGKVAAVPSPKEKEKEREKDEGNGQPKLSTARRPPANVAMFVYEEASTQESSSFGRYPTVVLCTEHAHQGCRSGFQPVSRLEQYAFLLNVALRRLYILLKKRGVVPESPVASSQSSQIQKGGDSDPYRNSGDIMRMKSVHLDRKLSATARIPKRSTIVESPAGKTVQPTDVTLHAERPREVGASVRPQNVQAQNVQAQNVQAPMARYPQQMQQMQRPSTAQSPAVSPHPQQHSQQQRPQLDGQALRPPYGRANTEVMIVDDSAPNSPLAGPDEGPQAMPLTPGATSEEGITLADIPQLMEAAQAREQHRSLPRQSAVPFIAELSPLELAIVKHCAVLVLHGSPLRDHFDLDEILEFVEVKKSGFWNKLFKAQDKKGKKKGVFGIPLELLVEREGADSVLGASRATLRIPSFIDDVVSAMRQMDMSIEGIFRKNGNIRRLKELTEAIDRDPASVDLTNELPVQIAALLKKFLRDLPDPLMTFKLHHLFVESQKLPKDEDRVRLLHMINLLLPKHHRDTMEVLFVFLKWVASFAHTDEESGSKMDLQNLSTVISPNILYSRGRDSVKDESFMSIRVVTALLENQDQYFVVPEEFLPILHDQEYFTNSLELPAKEFMKKCGQYMRLRSQGRGPSGLMTPGVTSPTINPFGSMPSGNLSDRQFPQRQNSDRPTTAPSENQHARNGVPNNKRQQSPHPPPLNHSPMSYPQPSGTPSLAQSLSSLQQLPADQDWVALQRRGGPVSPALHSRPTSFAFTPPPQPYAGAATPRSSGEHSPYNPQQR